MSSTRATVAASSHSVGRTPLTTFSRSGTTEMPSRALVAGSGREARGDRTRLGLCLLEVDALAQPREDPQ